MSKNLNNITEKKRSPRTIRTAVIFVVISIFFWAVAAIISIAKMGHDVISNYSIGLTIAFFAIFLFFTFLCERISVGKNWARILYSVLFGIGAIFALIAIPVLIYHRNYPLIIFSLLRLGIELIAIIKLYHRNSNAWFQYNEFVEARQKY